MTTSSIVPITMDGSSKALEHVRLTLPGGPPAVEHLYDPRRRLLPGTIRADLFQHSARGRFRKAHGTSKLDALFATGCFILRPGAAQRVFRDVPEDELTLRPVALFDKDGLLDENWVFLDIRARFPLDRDHANAVYAEAKNPHGSRALWLKKPVWGEGREPKRVIFRIAEFPHVTCVRAETLRELQKATRKAATPLKTPFPDKVYFKASWMPWDGVDAPVTLADAKLAHDAAQAFWRLYAGSGSAADRKVALRHPQYAFLTALVVDGTPKPDTRKAACKTPQFAYLYARDVDGKGHADTRGAASRTLGHAREYVRDVDYGVHAAVKKAVQKLGGADAVRDLLEDRDMRYEREYLKNVRAGRAAPIDLPPPRVTAPEPASREQAQTDRFALVDPKVKKKIPRHEPLDDKTRLTLEKDIEGGYGALKLTTKAKPGDVVEALHGVVDAVQRKKRKLGNAEKKQLAAVYGEQAVRAWGWQWASIILHGTTVVCPVSPKRDRIFRVADTLERNTVNGAAGNSIVERFNLLGDDMAGAPYAYKSVR